MYPAASQFEDKEFWTFVVFRKIAMTTKCYLALIHNVLNKTRKIADAELNNN